MQISVAKSAQFRGFWRFWARFGGGALGALSSAVGELKMEFTAFSGWLLLELFFSFGMPFAFAYDFYRRLGMHKAYWDMFCRKSMNVGLVAGLTGFLVFFVLYTFFNVYAENDDIGKYVNDYYLTTILYIGIGFLVGFVFIIFEKRRKQ